MQRFFARDAGRRGRRLWLFEMPFPSPTVFGGTSARGSEPAKHEHDQGDGERDGSRASHRLWLAFLTLRLAFVVRAAAATRRKVTGIVSRSTGRPGVPRERHGRRQAAALAGQRAVARR